MYDVSHLVRLELKYRFVDANILSIIECTPDKFRHDLEELVPKQYLYPNQVLLLLDKYGTEIFCRDDAGHVLDMMVLCLSSGKRMTEDFFEVLCQYRDPRIPETLGQKYPDAFREYVLYVQKISPPKSLSKNSLTLYRKRVAHLIKVMRKNGCMDIGIDGVRTEWISVWRELWLGK